MAPAADILLSLRQIKKSFAGVPVLRDVSLSVGRGEVVALVGENGAGKSTLKNIMSGLLGPDSGEIRLGEKVLPRLRMEDVKSFGIGTIHQELSLFDTLSVAENICISALPTKRGAVDRASIRRTAKELLNDLLEADIDSDAIVEDLSLGERQMVEIAKAIRISHSLLILDEPTTCLSIQERRHLFAVVKKLKARGYGIVYISHFMDEVYDLSDRIVVLRDGVVVGEEQADLLSIKTLSKLMVGREVDERSETPVDVATDAATVLSVRGLSDESLIREVSFELRAGEILGLGGLMGAGRSEIAEALLGLRESEGQVAVAGSDFVNRSPQAAIDRGLVLVSEDRRRDQAFLIRNLGENLVASHIRRLAQRLTGRVSHATELADAKQIVSEFGVEPGRLDNQMISLSGGNQQKAIVGRWLAHKPRICILDEPTKGVDIGAREAIHALIRERACNGMAFILISSDLPELMALSHRILVLHKGRIAGTIPRERFDAAEIVQAASTGRLQ
jgi:ABC-type sugar transport system ATPase subunit